MASPKALQIPYKTGHMKKIILIFAIILFSILPSSAIKKIEANPINVAVMLTEELDPASLAKTCDFYGYQHQGNQDGYTVFKHQNGSIIRFKFVPDEDGKQYSTIEVSSKETQKDRDAILKGLNFQKSGNTYERRSIGHITRLTPSSHSFLRLTCHPKLKPTSTP